MKRQLIGTYTVHKQLKIEKTVLKGQCHEKSMYFYHIRCCFRLKIWVAKWFYSFVILHQRGTDTIFKLIKSAPHANWHPTRAHYYFDFEIYKQIVQAHSYPTRQRKFPNSVPGCGSARFGVPCTELVQRSARILKRRNIYSCTRTLRDALQNGDLVRRS